MLPLRGRAGAGEQSEFKMYTYAIPERLQGELRPGHLIRIPFGHSRAQGIVMRLLQETAVHELRQVERLSLPDPVLWPWQLDLAHWLADFCAAQLSDCLALFVPPGLVTRTGRSVRPLYAWRIEQRAPASEFLERLAVLGRNTQQKRVWEHLRTGAGEFFEPREILRSAGLPATSRALYELRKKGLLVLRDGQVGTTQNAEDALSRTLELGGTAKYLPLLQALADRGGTAWKADLDEQTRTSLADWRWLADRGLVGLERRQRLRLPGASLDGPPSHVLPLNAEQAAAVGAMRDRLEGGQAAEDDGVLLQGVTGSGKTEVYLQALDTCLARGLQAFVLVPEIALTPQTVQRFAGRFPGRVSIVHSRLGTGERFDIFRQARAGAVDVIVGPRSALFAPLERPGLIVLDEEHDDSFKQNTEDWGGRGVSYDARLVAAEIGRRTGALLVLGSATPSLASLSRAWQGRLRHMKLAHRVGPQGTLPLPSTEVVDMRQELMAGNLSVFSRSLQRQLERVLANGEQAILLMNRRGRRTFVLCRSCGHVLHCPSCSTCLTYHGDTRQLECHTCDYVSPPPRSCPECGDHRIRYFGAGTELVTSELSRQFPSARVLRWDSDTARRKDSAQRLMDIVRSQQADIVVGTQMIAKGLDLPLVTLVGVVAADIGLFLPDFRAPERTCQLLVQVAGRAGRSDRGGRVIFQTYQPEHYAIQAAARNDYEQFCRRELHFRSQLGYPPHRRMARLVCWDADADAARQTARALRRRINKELRAMPDAGLEAIGPAPPYYERVRGHWRQQILILGPDPGRLLRLLDLQSPWRVDVDPVSTL